MIPRTLRFEDPIATIGALALLALALVGPAPAAAQTGPSRSDGGASWWVYDAIGYGGLGFGAGLVAAWGIEGEGIGPPPEALAVVAASTVAGVVTGAMIGRGAQRAVAQGRPVGFGHRVATLGGVVMAGSTLGALVAIPLIEGDGEGTPLGSDEQTVAVTVGGGTALAALWAWHKADDLSPSRVDVAPTVGRGGYGLRVRMEM